MTGRSQRSCPGSLRPEQISQRVTVAYMNPGFLCHQKRLEKKKHMTIRSIIALGISAAICYGCIIPSQEALRNPGIADQSQSQDKLGKTSANRGLIKPYIPSETAADQIASGQQPSADQSLENPTPTSTVSQGEKTTEAPVIAPTSPDGKAGPDTKGRKWEDQKVKAAATELARGLPGIKRLKVCYAVKEDEWWVTMYEQSGPAFELKQYTWSREQDKLEPFLVTKRIPADRLEAHLTEHEPDMACEVVDLTSFQR